MGDLGPPALKQDADHVEAQVVEIGVSLGEVLFGHEADCALFARRYGFQGGPVGGATTEFHLDYYEGVILARDQVQLAAPGAVVALDDLVALADQIAAR